MNGYRINGRETGNVQRTVRKGLFLSLFLTLFALTAVYASGGGEGAHEGPSWFDFMWRAVNFLILAGVLFWFMGGKVKDFFAGRQERIRTALADTVVAHEEAEKTFREYEAKLNKATNEIDEIKRMIEAQGLTEKERLVESARKTADKMKEDTRKRMEQEFNKASRDLRIEAVRLSTQLAEELIRKNIDAKDHEALVKDYIEKVASQ